MQTQLQEKNGVSIRDFLQWEVPWGPSPHCPGCPTCRLQHGTSLTALWATRRWGTLVNWLNNDVHRIKQEREGTISLGKGLVKHQLTGKGLVKHQLGAELFPVAHHLSFFFFFILKPCTPVPSGGRNLGAQPGSIASTSLFALNQYSGSVNHQSPARIVLYFQYTPCCSTEPPGWLDRLVHGLHGVSALLLLPSDHAVHNQGWRLGPDNTWWGPVHWPHEQISAPHYSPEMIWSQCVWKRRGRTPLFARQLLGQVFISV